MIFVVYKSGTGGNFVAALINKMLGIVSTIILSDHGNSHANKRFVSDNGTFGNTAIDTIKNKIDDNINVAVGVETANVEYILKQFPKAKIIVISFTESDLPQIKFNLFCKLHIDDYDKPWGKAAWLSFIESRSYIDKRLNPWDNDFPSIKKFCDDPKPDFDDGLGKICTANFSWPGSTNVINIAFERLFKGDKSLLEDIKRFLNITYNNDVSMDLDEYSKRQPRYCEETFNNIKVKKNEII